MLSLENTDSTFYKLFHGLHELHGLQKNINFQISDFSLI